MQAESEIKTSRPCRVLLAEDDEEMRKMLAWALRRAGYEVEECPDGMNLLYHLASGLFFKDKREMFDLIVSDIRMPGATGLEILEDLHNVQNLPPMILITAFGDEATHVRAEYYGAAALFDKPFDIDALIAKVCEIVPAAGRGRDSRNKPKQNM